MTVDSITDFPPWDLRDQFSDIETAYLWRGLNPPLRPDNWLGDKEHDPAIGLIISFLHDAEADELLRDCRISPYRRYYSRQDLIQYAAFHGQFPPFLFPEYRQPPNTENIGSLPAPEKATEPAPTSPAEAHETLPARAQSTFLKILDAALSQQYGQNWLNGDIPTCVSEWIKDLELQGVEIPAERRSLTRWFNRIAEKRYR